MFYNVPLNQPIKISLAIFVLFYFSTMLKCNPKRLTWASSANDFNWCPTNMHIHVIHSNEKFRASFGHSCNSTYSFKTTFMHFFLNLNITFVLCVCVLFSFTQTGYFCQNQFIPYICICLFFGKRWTERGKRNLLFVL